MSQDTDKIAAAWRSEGALAAAGARPPADIEIQYALIPPGGEWVCRAPRGAITRSIHWRGKEVALVNARGDLDDRTEADIAMGLRATPLMDKALRTIAGLADDPENLALIQRIARAAIAYVEMPAPAITEPDNDGAGED